MVFKKCNSKFTYKKGANGKQRKYKGKRGKI